MHIICPIAGVGSELSAFIISKPKGLIKIAGKRIIDHGLSLLKNNFPTGTGLTFIVGYKKEILRPYLEKYYGDYFDLSFTEQEPIGLHGEIPIFSGIGDAIALAAPFARDKDCFIFFSDRLPTEPFDKMFSILKSSGCDGVINVRKVNNPENYGITIVNQEKIVLKVMEKPSAPVSDLAITWGYMFSKRITGHMFDLLEKQAQEEIIKNTSHDFTNIIQKLIDSGANFKIHQMQSIILDFGRIHDFLEGNNYLLTYPELKQTPEAPLNSIIHPSATIENSTIIPPIYIGEKTSIRNSVIGPNVSIGKENEIYQSILSNLVIGDNCFFRNFITDHSLVGDYVTIQDLIKSDLTIGDSSTLAELEK